MSQTAKVRKTRFLRSALVTGSVAALTLGLAGNAHADGIRPLPYLGAVAPKQEMFQPLFDYDSDGCYPAPAVDASGNLNGGLKNSGSITGGCQTGHLGNANTYSRAKCDKGTGWCGIVYALYFEKDQVVAGADAFGHRHDWEAAVVWYHGNDEWPSYVSVSAHGDYTTKRFNDVERVGKRFKVVYHKDGGSTHAFRFAKFQEQAEAWGPDNWDRPNLVPYDSLWGTNRTAWTALANSDWGKANFPLQDKGDRFRNTLNKAKPSDIGFNAWS